MRNCINKQTNLIKNVKITHLCSNIHFFDILKPFIRKEAITKFDKLNKTLFAGLHFTH